jgi:hypothetical protein
MMIADIHMSPDVYQEWQAMSQEKQEIAIDAVERAILEAMEKLIEQKEQEYQEKSRQNPK